MIARLGGPAALFSAKCLLAAMLAYYLALRIGLTRPYWAVSTSYIVAQPLAGAVVSKAVFRLGGTLLGGAAAVLLVPNLVDAPELLSLALALWLGLCLYLSLQDRTPRSYVFLLAGYTASIIGFPSVNAPDAIFQTAVLRVEEIAIGIMSASLVHAFVLPQTVTGRLLTRIDAILGDVERWSRDALGTELTASRARDERRRLALDINELHQLSTHLPFDTARFLPRVRAVRALQDQLSLLLPLASAVEDRIAQLRALGGVPAGLDAQIERVRAWLAEPRSSVTLRATLADDLAAAIAAEEPAPAAPLRWRDALLLSLAARLAELVASHRAVRDLADQLHAPTRAPLTPIVAAALARASSRSFHRDRAVALRTALGAITTVLLGCAYWIGTGWADGAGAVLIAGVVCALFGANEKPVAAALAFLWGSVAGVALAGVYAFAVLPRVTDFATLAALFAPTLLLIGGLMVQPATALVALGTLLGLLNSAGLNASYAGDFAAFANAGLAQIAGTAFAVVTVALFQTAGADRSAARLIHAGWRDLARRSTLPGEPDEAGWISRMLDRLGLLATRLAARGEDPGQPLHDVLIDLRVGVAVAELRRLRLTAGAATGATVTPLLEEVAEHYRRRSLDRPTPDDPRLLATIDRALAGLARDPDATERRAAVLALTSLRRNLFAAAPAFEAAA